MQCDGRTCQRRKTHREQRRVCTRPNVLVFHVRRTQADDPAVRRHAVHAEERVSLPVVGEMEPAGVVYHEGRMTVSGHYTCICREADRHIRLYDDGRLGQPVNMDVWGILPSRVYLLVYVRLGGVAAFADVGEVAAAAHRRSTSSPPDRRLGGDSVAEAALGNAAADAPGGSDGHEVDAGVESPR